MKLGELRSLIRKTKGNVTLDIEIAPGAPRMKVALQKTQFLEELERAYPGGRNVETGAKFDAETGHITGGFDATGSASAAAPEAPKPAAGELLDSDDDLLDDEPAAAVDEDDDDLL